jgi:transposase
MLAGMKAYSKDLRLKVLGALDRSMDRREVVEVFGVSLPSIKRWLKMRRECTNIEARPIAGPTAAKRTMLLEWLPSQLQSNPDLTLEEHCEAFEDDLGVKVSRATMCRTIERLPRSSPWRSVAMGDFLERPRTQKAGDVAIAQALGAITSQYVVG